MKVLALTGGIGSGKSTVRQWFENQGIPTLDADEIGRELVAKNQPGLVEITNTFGEHVLNEDGELNRDTLRQMIFTDPVKKKQLEAILHPMIRKLTEARLQAYREKNESMVVVEIPLLAETGRPDYVDAVLVLDCPIQTQHSRIQKRSGLSATEIKRIIDQQASRQTRCKLADFIVNSDKPLKDMYHELEGVVTKFLTKSG